MLADLYDLTARIAAGKKWTKKMAYPRPSAKKVAGHGRTLASIAPRPVRPPKPKGG